MLNLNDSYVNDHTGRLMVFLSEELGFINIKAASKQGISIDKEVTEHLVKNSGQFDGHDTHNEKERDTVATYTG